MLRRDLQKPSSLSPPYTLSARRIQNFVSLQINSDNTEYIQFFIKVALNFH